MSRRVMLHSSGLCICNLPFTLSLSPHENIYYGHCKCSEHQIVLKDFRVQRVPGRFPIKHLGLVIVLKLYM